MDAPEGETDTTEPTEIDATGAKVADPGPSLGGARARRPAAPADAAEPDERDEPGERGRPDERDGRRLEVSGTQVCASTLASVSGAAVASVFGVAGTVAGAAVVSVIATVAGALYTHGLRQTGEKLQQSPVVRQWWQPRRTMAAPLSPTDDNSSAPAPEPADRPGWRDRLADRRWGVAVATAGVFVLSLLLITAVELAGQRPLSGSHDRDSTSIGSLLTGSEDPPDPADDAPAEDDAPGASTDTTADDEDDDEDDGGGDPAPGDGSPDTDGGTSDTTDPAGDGDTPSTTDGDTAPPTTDQPEADPG